MRIHDIACDQNIAPSNLRKIVALLCKTGILEAAQGRNGGIQLGKKSETISLFDILEAVGEELSVRDCTKGEYCAKQDRCQTTLVLQGVERGMQSLLRMYTLDKMR